MIEKRPYRKNLAIKGLIYLGGQEIEIRVKNVSITGFLAELQENDLIHDIEDIFQSIKISPVVDLYLPELRIVGEAEVVRSNNVEGRINLALEFRNISYDVDNVLYSRRAYRKNMTSPGEIIFNNEKHFFTTENVSVDGLMIRLAGKVEVESGTVTAYYFKHFELSGQIKVIWIQYDTYTTIMGLEYLYLEKDAVKGIPRFSHQSLT